MITEILITIAVVCASFIIPILLLVMWNREKIETKMDDELNKIMSFNHGKSK
tara:strand:+ start:297 stop:452 length:156 start_codon:yes stop_codon:yes gene_type:complete